MNLIEAVEYLDDLEKTDPALKLKDWTHVATKSHLNLAIKSKTGRFNTRRAEKYFEFWLQVASTSTYRLYTYDLWTDSDGGKTVNDVYDTGTTCTVFLNKNGWPVDDKHILEQLNLSVKAFKVDDHVDGGATIFFVDNKDQPAFELRKEEN